jgi:predicted lipoprotein with Yx(FWY)xxD motif
MKTRSRVWAVTASLVLTGTLAACSSAGTTYNAATPTSPLPSASASAASSPAAQAATVMTASSDLGTILVDGKGMTLYLFTKDTQGSGKSTCEGECLAAWPPLVGEPQAGEGTDQALLGTITRSDGTMQVTYNGWPLYYWAQDKAPGDTTGQGVNKVWWVLDANGDAIGAS